MEYEFVRLRHDSDCCGICGLRGKSSAEAGGMDSSRESSPCGVRVRYQNKKKGSEKLRSFFVWCSTFSALFVEKGFQIRAFHFGSGFLIALLSVRTSSIRFSTTLTELFWSMIPRRMLDAIVGNRFGGNLTHPCSGW